MQKSELETLGLHKCFTQLILPGLSMFFCLKHANLSHFLSLFPCFCAIYVCFGLLRTVSPNYDKTKKFSGIPINNGTYKSVY